MDVVVDHREPDRFLSLFDPGDTVATAQLVHGDFLIDTYWLFERKTIPDWCASIVDGRLFRQALALLNSAYHPVYVLEGGAGAIKQAVVRREAMQGAMVTLSIMFGLPILRSLDPPETVRLMRCVSEQSRRHAAGGVWRGGYRPKRRRTRQLYVLQGLPGIGKKRAEQLLNHFGSIEAVVGADVHELVAVEGIGLPTAQAIRQLVQGG